MDKTVKIIAETPGSLCPRCRPGVLAGRIVDMGDGPACLLCGYRPFSAPVKISSKKQRHGGRHHKGSGR